ncbi:MAG TPA: right-handed parallel beta-helix repeat-containing protein [Polyangiaceae bacterium]|nr:right-handed parallel beta-helix repeat-containing protein [Polyangiaceae bacterium]
MGSLATVAQAATYYVAPAPVGDDANPGTAEQPFASMARAQTRAVAGDTVLFADGTYVFTQGTTACASQTAIISGVVLSKSGTAEAPIHYFAAPGARPVFDFDGIRDSCRIKGILLSASFVHLRGFELRGVRQNNNLNHESWGVWIQGSNNTVEALDIHHIMGAGVFIQRGSNNLILNVDSHDNLDELTSNGAGESADGFGCHVSAGEMGNVFRGCRAWWNADDGYDFINAFAACTVEQSWAWYNGFRPGTQTPIGNGNGFKAGGYGADPANFPGAPALHVVRQNLSVRNRAAGFYANHHPGSVIFTNNTGYGNRPNFNMLGMAANGDDITVGVYRNNLAVGGTLLSNDDGADEASNSWTLGGITLTDADFQSVSELGLDAPRQADGSLPVLPNFRLAPDSDAIDRGVDVQLEFAGTAPDLGAFETGLVPPPGDIPAGDAPPATDAGTDPSGPGDTPADETPTFGIGGAQGDSTSGDGTSGDGTSGAGTSNDADPASDEANAGAGDGDPDGALSAEPNPSSGCGCTLRDTRPDANALLGVALFALLGSTRRSRRGRLNGRG